MTYYIEIRQTTYRLEGVKLVPLENKHAYTGFRSVYAYTEDTKNNIELRGNTRELKDPVYSDELLLDFDDNKQAADELAMWLTCQGYTHSKWFSGNRSIHIHVDIEPMFGVDVPTQQKQWVSKHAPKADTSFYHHCGVYRLPWTWHEKNLGNRKEKINAFVGTKLCINENVSNILKSSPKFQETKKSKKELTQMLHSLYFRQVGAGERRPTIFKLVTIMSDLDYSYEKIIDNILDFNINYCIPTHKEDILLQYVDHIINYKGKFYESTRIK